MPSGGDYITPSPPPYTVSGGEGEPLQQEGGTHGAGGGSVSPAPDTVSGGNAGTAVPGSDAFPDILSVFSGTGNGADEPALYAGTETVSGNTVDLAPVVTAIQEGSAAVCMLLGLIAGILFMNGFFLWKARE